ncbi:MAG: hypothetical protein ABIF22_01580 [bacterium]
MSIDIQKQINDFTERIPIGKRNPFQIFLMQEMGVKHKDIESGEIWSEKYGRIISEIIDNPNNIEIRDDIMNDKFKDASDKIYKLLN